MVSSIWFMATRGRPDQCRGLIKAFRDSGDIPEVAVMIDGLDQREAYAGIDWPSEWQVDYQHDRQEMTRCINDLLLCNSGRSSYGFFSDHFRPVTPMWNELASAASDWFMAWPVQNDDPMMSALQMAGAPTFGAKLIKELGWICLPSTVHIATEGPFQTLWEKLGIAKVLQRQVFARTWPLGPDLVKRAYKGVDYNMADIGAFHSWKREQAPAIIDRIREKMRADGYEFLSNGKIHPKYGCTPFGRHVVQPMMVTAL